ncbi:hypothetical protein [Burkholderia contaminans]|uniref:ParB/Sulfiredoxin domain-containing protein n=1 Tax=Burkholderia contaminans TaxID=488447 RepID=A0A3N8QE94_9BURK|nr:hypothetical protein [Burkholderia contaminans]RQT22124.1 hypothetical protein DF037_28880 [Burkholderia contaminans]
MNFDELVWVQPAVGEGWNVALDPVIWASVDALDAVWRGTSEYVGLDGRGSDQAEKYHAVGDFLRHAIGTRQIFVPTLSMIDGKAMFTDGRHRFAWLRDHGLRALPVEVHEDSLEVCKTSFETSERVGRFDPVAR